MSFSHPNTRCTAAYGRGAVLALWLALAPAISVAAEPPTAPAERRLTLEEAVATAVRNNPGLAAVEARARAIAAVPSQESALPDPTLGFAARNLPTDTFSRSQEDMTMMEVEIEQTIPFPGKLGLKEDAARYEAEGAFLEAAEAKLRLVRDVRTAWWELFYLDRAREVLKRNFEITRQLVETAEAQYRVGRGLQQDVLLAQTELSRLHDVDVRLEGDRAAGEARLRALLNEPAMLSVTPATPTELTVPSLREKSALWTLAAENRPRLVALKRQIAAAEARRQFARRDYYPDFSIGTAYGFRSGESFPGNDRADFFSAKVTLSLPLYYESKQNAALVQRSEELRERERAFDDSLLQVRAEVSVALADFGRARRQVELFKTSIVPQAEQTVESMRAGYLVNKVDFLNLARAQSVLYDYQIQYWKAFSDMQKALATVIAAVGTEAVYE